MNTQRQPLGPCNGQKTSRLPMPGSKLPMPGSRLPMPGSKLKPPTTMKRGRSPEPAQELKRQKIEPAKPTASRPGLGPKKTSGSKLTATSRPAKAPAKATTTRTGTTTTNAKTGPGLKRNSSQGSLAANGAKKAPAGAPAGKKRQPWDLKGRLQDMEAMVGQTVTSNEQLTDRIAYLESLNQELQGTAQQKEQISQERTQAVEELQRQIRKLEEEGDSSRRKFTRELEDLQFSKDTLQRQKGTLEGELSASKQETMGLKSTVAQLTSAQAGISAELSATKLNLEQSLQQGRLKDDEIAALKAIVAKHEQTIKEANEKLQQEEAVRRQLHNTIQELKGNIRVFCRMRPLLGEETVGNDGMINHVAFPDADQKVIELDKLDANLNESMMTTRKGSNNGKYEFSFDRVFQPNSSQKQVFEEISQLVQSALDGYNVCIFAYGQTGSGKTYTMEGPVEVDEEQAGMIPRAVQQIFQTARDLTAKGWKYEFEASFLEIYNETIRDLLGNGKEDVKHEIKMSGGQSNDVHVSNLTSIMVTSEKQVHSLLSKASENRAVAETKCNERSSRSHSVFRLKLTGTNEMTSEECQGTLNLIDLAGSERLKDSGSQGARLKETQAINKSLSNLGNVIMALANKDPHIPYRNSKLTYLLQNSLGGNSKTLMFVNVSPKEDSFQETLCSLRFATKVNQCNIGTAQKKVK